VGFSTLLVGKSAVCSSIIGLSMCASDVHMEGGEDAKERMCGFYIIHNA